MRFLGITAVAVLMFAGLMTAMPANAAGSDGFTAKILPSGRGDNTWHGDFVRITVYSKGLTGWSATGASGTLHVFMPQQSASHSEVADPPAHVEASVSAEVQTWQEVATVSFIGNGSPTAVSVPVLVDNPNTPYTPTKFLVSMSDGTSAWYSLAKNQLISSGNFDQADLVDGVQEAALRNTFAPG